MTHFVIVIRVKNYLVLKYHILVLFVHLCILLIVLAHIFLFSVNLLARYSFAPTQRHWNDIKHILRYFQGTTDMSPFYSNEKQQLLGYIDVGYLSDPHKAGLQTRVKNYLVLKYYILVLFVHFVSC